MLKSVFSTRKGIVSLETLAIMGVFLMFATVILYLVIRDQNDLAKETTGQLASMKESIVSSVPTETVPYNPGIIPPPNTPAPSNDGPDILPLFETKEVSYSIGSYPNEQRISGLEIVSYNPTEKDEPFTIYIPRMIDNKAVISIGDLVFSNLKIHTITIPPEVNVIGNYAFFNSSISSGIVFSGTSQLKEIRSHAFQNAKLDTIAIPSSVTNIGDFAFSGISTLTISNWSDSNYGHLINGTHNSNLFYIGIGAFKDTFITNTLHLRFPNLKYIQPFAFENTKADIYRAEFSASIGDYAFNHVNFDYLEIKSGSQFDKAFMGSRIESLSLNTVTVPDFAFSNLGIRSLSITSSGNLTVGKQAFSNNAISYLTFSVPRNSSVSFSQQSFENNVIPRLTGLINLSSISFGERAFAQNSITSIDLLDEVSSPNLASYPNASWSYDAFYGNRMTSIQTNTRGYFDARAFRSNPVANFIYVPGANILNTLVHLPITVLRVLPGSTTTYPSSIFFSSAANVTFYQPAGEARFIPSGYPLKYTTILY